MLKSVYLLALASFSPVLAVPFVGEHNSLNERDNGVCAAGIYGELSPILRGYPIAQDFCQAFFPIKCASQQKRAVSTSSTTSAATSTSKSKSTTTSAARGTTPKSTTTSAPLSTTAKSATSQDATSSAWSKCQQQPLSVISTLCSCILPSKTCTTSKTTSSTTSSTTTSTTKSTTTTTTQSTTTSTTMSTTTSTTKSTTSSTASPTPSVQVCNSAFGTPGTCSSIAACEAAGDVSSSDPATCDGSGNGNLCCSPAPAVTPVVPCNLDGDFGCVPEASCTSGPYVTGAGICTNFPSSYVCCYDLANPPASPTVDCTYDGVSGTCGTASDCSGSNEPAVYLPSTCSSNGQFCCLSSAPTRKM